MNTRKMQIERGIVAAIVQDAPNGRELLVDVNGQLERAWQEPVLSARAEAGDIVLLNTTAVRLRLGTGGLHFVLAVEGRTPAAGEHPGHIMKLRYTPLQTAVHAIEEDTHPLHDRMTSAETLDGVPVVICELHSMVPAVAMSLHHELARLSERDETPRSCNIVYVMTDGGALPIHFSRTVTALREQGLICGTVTVGHAYGGDVEAVNLYSGLLAARHALNADCIIVGMGPGIVGTGTRYGHTGIEVGQAVNAVHTLAGDPVVVPRISFADPRERHRGISHHTLTALDRVALAVATIPLPNLEDERAALIWSQLTAANLHARHHLVGVSGRSILDASAHYQVPLRTMGRTLAEDTAFFLTCGAAGEWIARHVKHPPKRYTRRVSDPVFTDKNC